MKIYSKLVIDINSDKVVEEESFEYSGPVAFCGGSGGGGGGEGRVEYPQYMEDIHQNWMIGSSVTSEKKDLISGWEWTKSSGGDNDEYYLTEVGGGDPGLSKPEEVYEDGWKISEGTVGDLGGTSGEEWAWGDNDSLGFNTIYVLLSDASDPDSKDGGYLEGVYSGTLSELLASQSITGQLSNAIGNSPYSGLSAYDPSGELSEIENAVQRLRDYINSINPDDFSQVGPFFDEYEAQAAYDAGMRDANAVNTSNFVVGKQLITAKFLPQKEADRISSIVEADTLKASLANQLAVLEFEAQRMKMIAGQEQVNVNRKIDVKDAMWDLEVYKYGGNVMASIGGGTGMVNEDEKPSMMQSALGGGLSGAASGAQIGQQVAKGTSYEGSGAGYGAAIGAAAGIGSALLSS